jgi:anaerobic selenocysteine-containing dehydrogenase
MKETKYTFCRICEAGCGLIAEVEDNIIKSIRPNKDHVASKGFACKKGLNFHELVHSPDRLKGPIKKENGQWNEIQWKDAFKEIGSQIKEIQDKYGKDSVALYAGNGAGFGLLHPIMAQGFMDAIGSKNVYSSATQDCSNKFAVAQHIYGTPLLQTIPDIDQTECLIIIGANPAASKFSFGSAPYILDRLKAIEERGGSVYHINPRLTETAKLLGKQVFIRPNSDVFLLLTFASEVIKRGGIDRAKISQHMKNFQDFEKIVLPYTPENTEELTQVKASLIIEMVDAYIKADGASLYCSTGINHSANPTLSFWLIEVINAISGNLDKKGGSIVGKGIVDFPKLLKKSGSMMRPDRSRLGDFPSVMDGYPGSLIPHEILTPGDGQIKALIVAAGNPLLTLPNARFVEKAFKELELIVCIDFFRNETAEMGHYVLPGISFMEHSDINFIFQSMMGVMHRPFLNYTDKIIEPLGNAREEMCIYTELAKASGGKFFASGFLQLIINLDQLIRRIPLIGKKIKITSEKILGLVLRLSRVSTIKKLRKKPHGILLKEHEYGSFLGKRILTNDGLLDLAPRVITNLIDELDESRERIIGEKDFILLLNKRESLTHNTYIHNAPSLMKQRKSNFIYMNKSDADKRKIKQGDIVRVESKWGFLEVPADLSDDMMMGTAAIPNGWGHKRANGLQVAQANAGVNANELTPSGIEYIDKVSGMARLSGIPIEIKKI